MNTLRRISIPGILGLVVIAALTSETSASLKMPDPEKELQARGYPTATIAQIEAAAKDQSTVVRFFALELLMKRVGREAIPTLKEALDDPDVHVRTRAARFLGMLGDMSGLERMRRDLAELAPNNGAPEPVDPNADETSEAERERKGRRNALLIDALYPAQVLAELGDPIGYHLATRMALEGESEIHREHAALVLIEIAKFDPARLKRERIDPAFILRSMAESEKSPTVLWMLMNVSKLENDIAIDVLDGIETSPFASEAHRKSARRSIEEIRARIEAEKEQGGTNK